MKYHKYVMSGEEVSCPECDKKYPQNFLKRHMKSAHENSQLDELDGKVHIFWEGHKILRNLHQLFVLLFSQMIGGDFEKFCVLLRIYEL